MTLISHQTPSHQTRGSVDETAAYWIMKLESPDCSPSDRAAFEKWRQTKSHAQAYEHAKQVLALVDRNLGSLAMTDLGELVYDETSRPARSRIAMWSAMATAALIVVALGVVLRFAPDPAQEAATATYETSIGERSSITLSDESQVTLNTDTRLQVWFDDNSEVRRVTLLRGQALFDINKDPRPFEVYAGGQRIQALGTAFDVWLDKDQGLRVTLVEGRVAIDNLSSGNDNQRGDRSGRTVTHETSLSPGEQLQVRPGASPNVVQADLDRVTGWRDGWVHLPSTGELLQHAVAEINRYSTKKITVDADPRLETLYVAGSFRTSQSNFLAAVETMYPVEAEEVAPGRILLRYRESSTLDR